MKIEIAYGAALKVGDPPLQEDELKRALSQEIVKGFKQLQVLREEGEVGFIDLPNQDLSPILQLVDQLKKDPPEWLVVVGIGGSSLGLEAALQALHPFLPSDGPKLRILDNVDPEKTAAVLREVDLSKAVVNVVSKSGGTAESMANFLVVFKALSERVGEYEAKKEVVFTTDPQKGTLRELANEHGFKALPVPPNVGGRFSVLSPVALFPLAFVGASVRELLDGARWMAELCEEKAGIENPALLLAGLHLSLCKKGKNIAVMMPYLTRLEGFSRWFCQLWAESLGKEGRGQTPLAAMGANDQHSLIQLFNDGPKDKMVTFLRVENPEEDVEIPGLFSGKETLGYLGGKSLHSLLLNEEIGTAAALAKSGVPSITISLERLNSFTLGALFMLYEITTSVCGLAMGINPFDQPGVEQGKRFTYALMQRQGFEREMEEVKRWHLAGNASLRLEEE